MRKLIIASIASAAVLVVGCQRNDAGEVQSERQELIEERQNLQETQAQAQQEVQQTEAEARQQMQQEIQEQKESAQQEVAEAREDVAEQRQDLAETREEFRQEHQDEAVGGAGEQGMAGQSISGTIESSKADKLMLKTEQGSRELFVTPDTEFNHLGRSIEITEIPKGSQVRASFTKEGNREVADRVEVLAPKAK